MADVGDELPYYFAFVAYRRQRLLRERPDIEGLNSRRDLRSEARKSRGALFCPRLAIGDEQQLADAVLFLRVYIKNPGSMTRR